MKLEGFDKFAALIHPQKFERRLHKNVGKATRKVGLVAEGKIKESIYSGEYKQNSAVTVANKGSARPLVDTGQLVRSINSKTVDWMTVDVGVLRKAQVSSHGNKDIIDVATILHYGATIKVTQKMRNYFAAKSREEPDKWRPIRSSTRFIVIPPRPFLNAAVTRGQQFIYKEIWDLAVEATFAGL